VPAAEPSLTITGTVRHADGKAFGGVTIMFDNSAIAITDNNGLYEAHGFDAGHFLW